MQMKKLFLTLMVMLFAVMTVSAQQKPLVLGKSHAMQRVEVNSRYLLLPVQEREDNANIRIDKRTTGPVVEHETCR